MANYFDQFDAKQDNFFDQFDDAPEPDVRPPAARGLSMVPPLPSLDEAPPEEPQGLGVGGPLQPSDNRSEDRRAQRGFGRSAYGSGLWTPGDFNAASSAPVEPAAPRPDPTMSRAESALRSVGQGVGQGAAGIPKGAAIAQRAIADDKREAAGNAIGFIQQEIAGIDARLAGDDLPEGVRAQLQNYRDTLDKKAIQAWRQTAEAEATTGTDAKPRSVDDLPLYKVGQSIQDAMPKPDPAFAGDFWTDKVAQGGGTMIAFMASAMVPVVGPASAGIMGSGMEASSLYEEAIEAGADHDTAMSAAGLGGLVGLAEVIPIMSILGAPAKAGLLGGLRKIIENAGEEAAQEAFQTTMENLIAQGHYDPERGTFDGVGEAALIGGILGGGMGSISATLQQPDAPPATPDEAAAARLASRDRPDSPRLTEGDRASALPNDVIDDGKAIQEAIAAGDPIPDTTAPQGLGAGANVPEGAVPLGTLYQSPTPEAATSGDRFEELDETETVDGETRPTGRKVRVNLDTGQAEVVEEAPPVAQEAPTAPTPAPAPEPAPEAVYAPPRATPTPDAPTQPLPGNIEVLDSAGIADIETDAATFQYKADGDEAGVTDRLRDVTEWDGNRSGIGIVYEYEDGRRVMVDGHQRLGLAKRAAASGQEIDFPVRTYREVDGITEAQARSLGAEKNIAEGSGTALDAAKVFRDTRKTPKDLNLPRANQMVRDGEAMAKLSDQAFGMVVNQVVTERHGAIVGRLVPEEAKHADILGLLARVKPDNATQAEAIVRQAAEAEVTETQTSLFGEEEVSTNLYMERAKVLDRAMRDLGKDISTFKTLTERSDTIAAEGNLLQDDANTARVTADAAARAVLMKQANTKGPISDALTQAARQVKDGEKVATATRRFVAAVRGDESPFGDGGAEPSGVGPRDEPAPQAGQAAGDQTGQAEVEQTPEGAQTLVPGVAPITQADRDQAEIDKRQAAPLTGADQGPGSGRGDLFGDPSERADLFDAPAAETPASAPGLTAEEKAALRAEPSATEDYTARTKFTEIGVNNDGLRVFEDDRGVRSYVEGGIRHAESVGITIDKGKRGNEYLTRNEAADKLLGKPAEPVKVSPGRLRQGYKFRIVDGQESTTQERMADDGYVVTRASNRVEVHNPNGSLIYSARPGVAEEKIDSAIYDDRKRPGAPTSTLSPEKQARLEEIKAKLAKKLGGQINVGVDPEIVALALEYTALQIEAGARKFRAIVQAMMDDFGLSFERVGQYARNAYNSARDDIEAEGGDVSDMDASGDVLKEFLAMKKAPPVTVATTPTDGETVPDLGLVGDNTPDAEPTDGQKEGGNYKLGHISWNGLDVSIENLKGSERSGKDKDGEKWSVTMPAAYGYIRRSEGADGDHFDIYMGPNPESDLVLIVDQQDADSGRFDEHKAILGANTAEEAAAIYLAGFSDGRGLDRVRGAVEMTVDDFKDQIEGSNNRPIAQKGEGTFLFTDVEGQKPTPGAPQTALTDDAAPQAPGAKAIEDFGEKIEGAAKDRWRAYADKLDEVADSEIAAQPLSKSFPAPDYEALIEDGIDPWTVSFIRAARDMIPNKPRARWKLGGWVAQVTALRKFSGDILSGKTTRASLEEKFTQPEFKRLGDKITGTIDLYAEVGHGQSLKGLSLSLASYSMKDGVRHSPHLLIWEVQQAARSTMFSNMPRVIASGKTREDALAAFKEAAGGLTPVEREQSERKVRFDIYRYPGRDGFFIGKKIGKNTVDLETFETVKEAREYRRDNQADLEAKLAKMKDIPSERKATNSPRVGVDHRNGADVAPEQFSDAFGFRGVQFGNYVEGARRQQDLNEAYDGFMDLAGIIGVDPKTLSLNGDLALAFGARGKGGKGAAKAHYEPGQIVINLTKRTGAGSLAHEWFHGLDNYFERGRGRKGSFITDRPSALGAPLGEDVRPEVLQAFIDLRKAINQTSLKARSAHLDKVRSTPYWTTGIEMHARSFESYVISKLHDLDGSNDYLANIVDEKVWKAEAALGLTEPDSYPYPVAAEVPVIRAGFDNLFQTIEAKETDRGIALFRQTREAEAEAATTEKATIGGQVYYETKPEMRAKAGELADEMRAEIDRMNLKGIDVVAAERLFGLMPDGSVVPLDGAFVDGLMLVALLTKGGQDPIFTIRHETIHALRDPALWGREHGLFRPAEWMALEKAARTEIARLAEVKELYSGFTEDIQIEEVIADMFADWAAGKREVKGFVKTAFQRIQSFLNALRAALRGQNINQVDEIFSRVYSGEVGARGGTAGTSAAARASTQAAPVFHSPLLRAIQGAKQKKAPAKDWMAIIGKLPGVKKIEVQWLGVDTWLEAQEGQVTREALEAFIAANQVQVQTDVLQGEEDSTPEINYRVEDDGDPIDPDWAEEAENYMDEAREELEAEGEVDEEFSKSEVQDRAEEMARERWEPFEFSATLADFSDYGEDFYGTFDSESGTYYFGDLSAGPISRSQAETLANDKALSQWEAEQAENALDDIAGPSQFGDYTEEGGENYREILLRVPTLHEQGPNRPIEADRLENESAERYEVDHEGENIRPRPRAGKRPFVQTGHFEQPNIVVHARVTDRQDNAGGKVLFVEEIQSDLASKHREATESPEISTKRMELETVRDQLRADEQQARREIQSRLKNEFAERFPAAQPLDTTALPMMKALAMRGGIPMHGGSTEFVMHVEWLAKRLDRDDMSALVGAYEDARAEANDTHQEILNLGTDKSVDPTLPDTPFKEGAAYTLMVKRLLREAAEKGYAKLAWTPGYMQAERWNAAGQSVVEEIKWNTEDGERTVNLTMAGGNDRVFAVNNAGVIRLDVAGQSPAEGKPLSALVGQKIASQIMDEKSGAVSGQKITFSDSGYAIAYDQQIKKAVDAFARKFGSRVTVDESLPDMQGMRVSDGANDPRPVWSVEITPEMRASALQSQAMFSVKRDKNARRPTDTIRSRAFIPDRRVWDELTAENKGMWARIKGAGAAAHDSVDRARVAVQDRFLPVLRAQEAISRETGEPIPDDLNVYIAEETFSGKVGRHLFEIDEDFTKPIVDLIGETKGDLTTDMVGEWLIARHAPERNEQIAKINPKMPDGGSGMSTEDARKILKDAQAGPHADVLAEIGALIDGLRDRTLDLRVDKGLMTPADGDLWRKQYNHYVPLKGFADTDHSEASLDATGTGRRFNVRGAESRRALGRRSEAFNPLQAAITQAQEVAIRAEENAVGQTTVRLIEANPSEMWEVKTPKEKRFFNKTTGLVETRIVSDISPVLAPNEMAVKVDGKERRIIFNDPRLARALGSVGADQMNSLVKAAMGFSRWFSAVNTMMNPEFVVTNAFRDMSAAQVNIQNFGEAERNKIAKAMIRNWPKAFKAAYRGQLNKADTEWTKYYLEYERSGAKVSFWRMEQPEAGRADLDRRVAVKGGGIFKKASRLVSLSTRDNPVLSFIEHTNLAVDNAVRLAAFVEARKQGWSKAKAASLSKNLTVNFNRRGEIGASINAFYPFANAAMQGTQIIFRAASSKRVRKIMLGLVAVGFLEDQVNSMLSAVDDDDELAWDKVPDYKQERNLMLMLPDNENPISIPLPYGYSVLTYAGKQLSKVARGVKPTGDAVPDFLAASFAGFSPLNGQNLQQTVTPTVLKPLIDVSFNQDWLGRKIRPESAFSDYGPSAYKFFSGVSTASRLTADALNRVTGGNRGESGLLDISPEYIDHLFGFATGGAGRFAGRTADLAAKLALGDTEDITANKIPFVRLLAYDTSEWLDRDRYYRFRDRVREASEAVEVTNEANESPSDETIRLANMKGRLKLVEKSLSKLRKSRRALDANRSISDRERRESKAEIAEIEAKKMLGFNGQFVRNIGPQGE